MENRPRLGLASAQLVATDLPRESARSGDGPWEHPAKKQIPHDSVGSGGRDPEQDERRRSPQLAVN